MSKLMKKALLFAKIESSYGTDPTPTGPANAILCRAITPQPISAEFAERMLIRPYFGANGSLPAAIHSECEFEVEYAAAGGAGTVPAWGPLLRACGFSQTATTTAVASITRTGAVATLTKTAHGRLVGDSIVVSGAVETEYNGTFTVATVPDADTLTYAVTGTPTTPATGTILLGTTVIYTTITSALETVTLYYYLDGLLHKIKGARGTVSIDQTAKGIPVFKFKFTGLYTTPTDETQPTDASYAAFMQPMVVNNTNTATWALHGITGKLQTLSLDVANEIVFRSLIGSEAVHMTDRKPSGNAVFELDTVAVKDWWTAIRNATASTLSITHGVTGGSIMKLDCPKVSLINPQYSEQDGIAMLGVGLTIQPNTGNDEIVLTVK